jgi:hypothetical protein
MRKPRILSARKGMTVAKGQVRSNKEKRKPKANSGKRKKGLGPASKG